MTRVRRLGVIMTVGLALVGIGGIALAQTAVAPARVGYLAPFGSPPVAFVERLRELGWREGENVVIEVRRADGKADVLPALASQLVQRQVQVIVTTGTTAIRAVQEVTTTVPIVMAGGGDPVATGFANTIGRPGGNITGVSLLGQELVPKSLSLLHEAVPRAKRIGVLANAANPANAFWDRITAEAAKGRGIQSQLVEVRSVEDLEPVIARTQADALLMLADPLFNVHARRIAEAAIKRRLPLAVLGRHYVEAGGLMSYAVSFRDVNRQAADYVDRILKGAKPAELPIEQPRRYELVFNARTARALGLTIPQALLLRADQVLE